MIRDKELATLFKAESDEHLARMDELLLHLEAEPGDRAALEEVFREAHSLKGSARMVGERSLESVAHRFEDALNTARRTGSAPPELFACLSNHLEASRKLVTEAATGEPAGVDIGGILTQLDQVCSRPAGTPTPRVSGDGNRATAPTPAVPLGETVDAPPVQLGDVRAPNSTPQAEPQEEPATPEAAPQPATSPSLSGFKISTIRVAPERLDTLMTHSAELSATKLRISRRRLQIEELLALSEEWSRDAQHRSHLVSEEAQRTGSGNGTGKCEGERLQRLGELLAEMKSTSDEDTARLEYIAGELEDGIRSLRLLPLSTVFGLFPRMVHDLARQQQKEIEFVTLGGETTADKRIVEEIKDPLMHLIRNAIDHGIEAPGERERAGKPRRGTIRLKGYQTGNSIVIELTDDGRGLDVAAVKAAAVRRNLHREEEIAALTAAEVEGLIFSSGLSTSPLVTDLSGRGVGLDVVRRNVENLKGSIQVESVPGAGCTMRIRLPVTLATARVLIVQVGSRPYALPVESVTNIRLVSLASVFSIEGRDTIDMDHVPLSVAKLSEMLELPGNAKLGPGARAAGAEPPAAEVRPCIVLCTEHERLGVFVDALVDEQEVVLKPLSPILKRVRNVSGATILGTGEICTVLNPADMIRSARKRAVRRDKRAAPAAPARKRLVLLAEDSITTRTQEKRILESAGYEVVTAVDGMDAWNRLSSRRFDAVVTDIQMPNLDGLGLTARIRQDKRYSDLPVILVTSLASEEDKKRGIEVGANAYITKPAFDQKLLLDTLSRLL